jgi:hypothetical protein
MDYQTLGARVLCNPKGYGLRSPGGRLENPGFDPRLVVSL